MAVNNDRLRKSVRENKQADRVPKYLKCNFTTLFSHTLIENASSERSNSMVLKP